MVKRRKQKITSPYGDRRTGFHDGVDLRCYNFINWKKQPIVFPEKCKVLRYGYQEKWEWNVVVRTLHKTERNYILKFIHLEDPRKNVKIDSIYDKNDLMGWTTVTDYMIEHEYYEHLHFGVFIEDHKNGHVNPKEFFISRGTNYG